jgi:hypothetical protein
MRSLCHHPSNCRSIDTIYDLIESFEYQALNNQLMLIGRPDSTAKILDLKHFPGSVSGFFFRCHLLQFLNLFAAQLGDFARLFKPFQTVKGSFDHIVRISGTY